nr:autotransporter outer membrane beta-barrel domain-containing protein [Cetobacterium sp. 2A]
MSYLTIKPKENEWIIQGKGIYTGVKNDNASSGKNYYGFDTGHRNYKTTTSTSGGLATFEYGLSDKTSIGGVIGGNNQDINFKGSSKIKGNSLYLGTFAKTDINNFKLMAGLGYQYTAADADRSVSNMYDSFKTSDKYDINSLNAFAEVKYSIEGNDNWTLEPKARLSYYYIEQDSVNEGYTPGQLSIAVDKANSNTADLELGIDLIKNVYLQQGKLKNIFSFGIINTIGDKSKELNGYVLGNSKDGNKFDIQGIELPRTSGKVAYNLELEQTSGMIYTAGVSMEFAKDYNRNASATIGLGYKF